MFQTSQFAQQSWFRRLLAFTMRVLIAISCLLAVASAGYHGYHIPVIGPHGVPLDEPAVAHARAEHAAAHAKAAVISGSSHYDDGHYDDGHYDDGHYDNGQYNGHNDIGQYDNGQYDDGHYHGEEQYAGHDEHYGYATQYHGPLHYPVIGKYGVPVDEPAVQHARAEHAAAHASAEHGHDFIPYLGHYAQVHYAPIQHGIPHDTPEVAAAKAAHFAAHAEAAAHGHGHYRRRRGVYNYGGLYHGAQHVPVIGPHGVPQDEPAVAHAKAEHAAAYAKAAAHAGSGHYDDGHYDDGHYDDGHYAEGHYDHGHYAEGHYANSYDHGKWNGPIHVPVIDKHGVPVEEHAIQHARAEHAAAHAAASHGGHYGGGAVAYAGDYGYGGHGSSGAQHIPVIGPHGVPQEEPAVAHARAEHAAAHAAASHGGHGVYYH